VSSGTWNLQVAIRAIFLADSTLMGKITGVYENAPQGTAKYPYVTIGDILVTDWKTHCRNGEEDFFDIKIWENKVQGALSNKNTFSIESDIRRLLANKMFPVADMRDAICYFEETTMITDRDGKSRQAVCRYRIQIQEATERT